MKSKPATAKAAAPPKIDHRLAEVPKQELTAEQLKAISSLAMQAKALEKQIENQEAETKRTKERLNKIVQDTLPSMMLAAQVPRLDVVIDGVTNILKTEDWITANITEENREPAHKWLRANKFGSIIKTAVTAAFGMGDEKKAAKLYMQLAKEYDDVKKDERVHSSTLRAFVAERLAKGEELPPSISVHSIPITTIKEARKEK